MVVMMMMEALLVALLVYQLVNQFHHYKNVTLEQQQQQSSGKVVSPKCPPDRPIISTLSSSFFSSPSYPLRPMSRSQRTVEEGSSVTASSSTAPNPLTLSAVLLFRLFPQEDRLHFTETDLMHWLEYMRYAGVDHFYLYDNCQHENECLSSTARRTTTSSTRKSSSSIPNHDEDKSDSSSIILSSTDITYIPWRVSDYVQAQTPAYNHHLQTHFPQAIYEIILDLDEYPYMPSNTEPNFLKTYALQQQQLSSSLSSQRLIKTLFYGGTANTQTTISLSSNTTTTRMSSSSSSLSSSTWRIARYTKRRRSAEQNGRTKPLYKPPMVNYYASTNLHEMELWSSTSTTVTTAESQLQQQPSLNDQFKYSPYDIIMGYHHMEDEQVLRLAHYWCERLLHDEQVEQKEITTRPPINVSSSSSSSSSTTSSLIYDDSMVRMSEKVMEWSKRKNVNQN